MSEQSTNRKPVEDFTVGEHISDNTGVHELVHRLPYSNGDGGPMHALTLRPLGGGDPWVAWYAQGVKLHVATDAEIREVHSQGRRTALVLALHKLADDIAERRLPIPRYSLHIGGVVESRAELAAWAQHLGGKAEMGGTDKDIPVVRVDVDVPGGPSLTIGWQSAADPEPAADAQTVMADAGRAMNATGDVEVYEPPADADPVRDWYFTFGSGQQHDGKYVVIRGTHDSARNEMVRHFGNRWSFQYAGPDRAGVEQFDLIELPRAEWPQPAAVDAPAGA